MTKKIIIFHSDCHDGVTALWVALRKWPDAEPYTGKYDNSPDLTRLKGADVVFVDFSWKRTPMRQVIEVANSVMIVDHHKTAEEELVGHNLACELVFDMNRSGSGLAWDTLFPTEKRPELINHVEDRDLWKHAVPNSDEVYAACTSYPLTLEQRNLLMKRNINTLIEEGTNILRYHNKLIETASKFALWEEIGGVRVPSMAHPNIEIASELAGKLAVGHPFAAVWHDRPDETRYYSLRSAPDGMDVSLIARKYGGGGHYHASGFVRKKSI